MGLNIGPPPVQEELDVAMGGPGRGPSARFGRSWVEWFRKLWLVVFDAQNSGTTAQRPTEDMYVGKPYFDTDLGFKIAYNGTDWVDGAGTVV